jgi:hypothetical protein
MNKLKSGILSEDVLNEFKKVESNMKNNLDNQKLCYELLKKRFNNTITFEEYERQLMAG